MESQCNDRLRRGCGIWGLIESFDRWVQDNFKEYDFGPEIHFSVASLRWDFLTH